MCIDQTRQAFCQIRVGRERCLGRAVCNQFHRGEQSQSATHIADNLVFAQSLQLIEQVTAVPPAIAYQVFAGEDVEVLQCRGCADGMPAECDQVAELLVALTFKRLRYRFGHDGGAQRRVAASQRLRYRGDVRLDAEVLRREVLARPSESRYHLVSDQHNVVLVCDLTQAVPVLWRRYVYTRCRRDRLGDHRRNSLRSGVLYRQLEVVGATDRSVHRIAFKRQAIRVPVRNVDSTHHVWTARVGGGCAPEAYRQGCRAVV